MCEQEIGQALSGALMIGTRLQHLAEPGYGALGYAFL
jgi:hypothetical protein